MTEGYVKNDLEISFRDHFLNRDYESAITSAINALKETKAFDAMHIVGLSLIGQGKIQEGIEWLATSVAWPNSHPTWFINAGMVLKDSKHPECALIFVERGLAAYPDNADLHCAFGFCLAAVGRWQPAIDAFDAALQISANYNAVLAVKGFCYFMLSKHDEAIALLRECTPTPEVICTWGCALIAQAKPHDALALLETPYFDPEPPIITYNKSVLYMGTGKWPLGWKLYHARFDPGSGTVTSRTPPPWPFANSLDEIRDKHLVFLSEQGLGDVVMFMRYAELLRPLVARMTLVVPDPLVRLMGTLQLSQPFDVKNLDDGMAFMDTGECVIMPVMSAPGCLETTVATIPPIVPFSVSIEDRRLRDTGKPKIGLVWTGSTPDNPELKDTAQRRSMTFAAMQPLLDQSDKYTFISLQMPDHRADDPRLFQPLQEGFDLLETAAIIQQLDLVITIDSVVAHLAGSLGKPVWMLSRHDGEWRWFWDHRKDSPWYPSMRIYQQETPDSWPEVIGRVANDLAAFRPNAKKPVPEQ